MSNSNLISGSYTSHRTKTHPRNQPISIFTPHHAAGNLTFQGMKNIIDSGAEVSPNYVIQSDGKIFLFVDEADRSWCSFSPWNDNRAVTVEVANDGGAPNWHVSDAAIESLINLGVDVAKRNGLPGFNYTGDENNVGTLTRHNYFAYTECPGPYLTSKLPYIDAEIKRRLKGGSTDPVTTPYSVGSLVDFKGGNVYATSVSISRATSKTASRCKITQIARLSAHPYHCISEDGKGVYGWVNATDVEPVAIKPSKPTLYTVSIQGANEGDKNTLEKKAKDLKLKYTTKKE